MSVLFIFIAFSVCSTFELYKEKKEEIWLSPMTKAHTPTEMSKGQSDQTNNATKKFDYTAVADRQIGFLSDKKDKSYNSLHSN